MRRLLLTSVMLSFFVALGALAQLRGTGRIQGNVFDKATKKPVVGATVTISLPSGNTQPIVVKSDSKGHWAALGMSQGTWNIDITAPGYVTSKGSAAISEFQSTPPIRTDLEPQAGQEAAPAAAEVAATPAVPMEAINAIKEGEALLNAKPGDVVPDSQPAGGSTAPAVSHTVTAGEVKENAKRAAADFEKALPMIPTDKPELVDVRNQVLQVLAQAYYKSGDVKNAIATLEKLNAVDPIPAAPDAPHITREVLLANLYLENGQLDQGRAVLDKLPPTALTDPTAYLNIGILFLNKKNTTDAATYFTKAIDLDPKRSESYYYRGLAELQGKKNKEAKADFEKVIELAPDSTEAHDAKQLLANLK